MTISKTDLCVDDGSEPSRGRNLELIRVPPGGRLGGIICDETPAKVWTHYWGGRTVPCMQDCEACKHGRRRDWHGYAMLYHPTTTKLIVVEMTEACRETIIRFLDRHKSTRGCRINLCRRGIARNGRLSIEIAKVPASVDLPPEIDLLSWLCHLWAATGRGTEKLVDDNRAYRADQRRLGITPEETNGHAR